MLLPLNIIFPTKQGMHGLKLDLNLLFKIYIEVIFKYDLGNAVDKLK